MTDDKHITLTITHRILNRNAWTNGDWHFGILAGSSSPWVGTKILHDRFLKHDNAINLMTVGVGLFPFRSCYRKGGRLPFSRVASNWYSSYLNGENVIYRARLSGSARYGEVFSSHLDLMLKEAMADDLAARNEFFKKRLYALFDIIARNRID
jgi:hypothetical protein